MKKVIMSVGVISVATIALFIFSTDQTNSKVQTDNNTETNDDSYMSDPVHLTSLVADGENDPERYPSNHYLYEAHQSIAKAMLKQSFETDKPYNPDMVERLVKKTEEELQKIDYDKDDDKKEKLEKAIELTHKDIEQGYPKENDDKVYIEKIHHIAHGLLEHFNSKANDINVNKWGDPVADET
ncbi:hypothetical protein GCM10028778_20920 [Barrientosiimonas marina]|uniref:Uncharacterized protein n=1 Tax=Lentibacillus kimchii TaxID=1542911 RepID=A0ABW2UW61_9BACI